MTDGSRWAWTIRIPPAFTRECRQRAAATPCAVAIGKVLGNGVFVIDGKLYDAWGQSAELIGDLKTATRLPGAHNWQNAALCYAAVRPLVSDRRAIMPAIVRFPGLAHRIEDVGQIGKVRFINDSKATNADAAARALACYSDIYWIAGGLAKEGGIDSLSPYFPQIRKAYLIGKAAGDFEKTLSGRVPLLQAGNLERAIRSAYEDARSSASPESGRFAVAGLRLLRPIP